MGPFHKQGSVLGPRNLSVTKTATAAAFQLVLTVGQDSLTHNYPNKRSSEVSSTGVAGGGGVIKETLGIKKEEITTNKMRILVKCTILSAQFSRD